MYTALPERRPRPALALAAMLCALTVPCAAPSATEALASDAGPGAPQVHTVPGLALADALEAAWQRAVAAARSEAALRAAEAGRQRADSPFAAPPALVLSHTDDRMLSGQGWRESELGLVMPLWLPGQRSALGAALDAGSRRAEAARRAARLQLAGELREQAWAVVMAAVELEAVETREAALTRLAEDVRRRIAAGELPPADGLAAEAERLDARAARREARQALRAARRQWETLVGPGLMPLQPGAAHPAPARAAGSSSGPTPPALQGAPAAQAGTTRPPPQPVLPAAHPLLALAAASTEQARKDLALVRAANRDPPQLQLGLRREQLGTEPELNALMLSLTLPFGTEARNRPAREQALGGLDVARLSEQRLRERLEGELHIALEALTALRARQSDRARQAALLRARATLLRQAYVAGQTPLPELLRALAAADRAEADLARDRAALGRAHDRLKQALGELP